MTQAVMGGVPKTMEMLIVLMIAFLLMHFSSRLRMAEISFSKKASLVPHQECQQQQQTADSLSR